MVIKRTLPFIITLCGMSLFAQTTLNLNILMKRSRLILLFPLISIVLIFVCCNDSNETAFDNGLELIKIPTTKEINLNTNEKNINCEINAFGIRTLNTILKTDGEKNIAFSPLSFIMATSLYHNTISQIYNEELNLTSLIKYDDISNVNLTCQKLMCFLPDESQGGDISLGNSIWLNECINIPPSLKEIATNNYFAEIYKYNLENPDIFLERVAKWVEIKTKGEFKDFRLPEVDSRALTINATFFKSDWKTKFDKSKTIKKYFNTKDTDSKVDMMSCELDSVPYFCSEKWQAIVLPFEGNYEMMLILPSEDIALSETTEGFGSNFRTLFKETNLTLELPKFQIYNNLNLNKYLNEEIGAGVNQTAFIEINEDGAKAVAVTTVADNTPKALSFNRPFLYSIVNRTTGTILMLGAVTAP